MLIQKMSLHCFTAVTAIIIAKFTGVHPFVLMLFSCENMFPDILMSIAGVFTVRTSKGF